MKRRILKKLAIGKRFRVNGKTYEVKEWCGNDDEPCLECAFFRKDSCPCYALRYKIPQCLGNFRTDRKHVVFVEVKEEK